MKYEKEQKFVYVLTMNASFPSDITKLHLRLFPKKSFQNKANTWKYINDDYGIVNNSKTYIYKTEIELQM